MPPHTPHQEAPKGPTALRAQRGRVLLVDDERSVREVFQRSLLLAGFDVIVASGGAEGLDILRTDPAVRLVLLDLDMPNIDGRRFREVQRQDPRLAAVPSVIVSGIPMPPALRHELQAADYVPKPVGRARLLAVVERYCLPIGAAELPVSQPTRFSTEQVTPEAIRLRAS